MPSLLLVEKVLNLFITWVLLSSLKIWDLKVLSHTLSKFDEHLETFLFASQPINSTPKLLGNFGSSGVFLRKLVRVNVPLCKWSSGVLEKKCFENEINVALLFSYSSVLEMLFCGWIIVTLAWSRTERLQVKSQSSFPL